MANYLINKAILALILNIAINLCGFEKSVAMESDGDNNYISSYIAKNLSILSSNPDRGDDHSIKNQNSKYNLRNYIQESTNRDCRFQGKKYGIYYDVAHGSYDKIEQLSVKFNGITYTDHDRIGFTIDIVENSCNMSMWWVENYYSFAGNITYATPDEMTVSVADGRYSGTVYFERWSNGFFMYPDITGTPEFKLDWVRP